MKWLYLNYIIVYVFIDPLLSLQGQKVSLSYYTWLHLTGPLASARINTSYDYFVIMYVG